MWANVLALQSNCCWILALYKQYIINYISNNCQLIFWCAISNARESQTNQSECIFCCITRVRDISSTDTSSTRQFIDCQIIDTTFYRLAKSSTRQILDSILVPTNDRHDNSVKNFHRHLLIFHRQIIVCKPHFEHNLAKYL